MNIYRKQHLLLKVLNEALTIEKLNSSKDAASIGLSREIICKKLGINGTLLLKIANDLSDEEEIGFYDLGGEKKGYVIYPKGSSSFYQKKYLKKIENNRRGTIVFWMGLITAGLTIFNMIMTFNNKNLKKRVEINEERIDSLFTKYNTIISTKDTTNAE